VRLRDQGHDREPEAAPACASRLVGAAEAVECAIEEAVGEAGSGVGDVQLDDVVTFDGEEWRLLLVATAVVVGAVAAIVVLPHGAPWMHWMRVEH
jgi:hypothetical protein